MDMALNETFPARNACNQARHCKLAKDLDEKEHLILMNRVLGTMRLADVADIMGVSTERVRKIEARLKVKLRTRLFETGGK